MKPTSAASHVAAVSTCMTKSGISRTHPTNRKTPPTGRVHANKGTESGRLERSLLGKPSVSKKPLFVASARAVSAADGKSSAPMVVRQSSVVKTVADSSASSSEGLLKRQQAARSPSGRAPPVHSHSVPTLRPKPAVPVKPNLPKPELKPKPILSGHGRPPSSLTAAGKSCPQPAPSGEETVLAQPGAVTGRTMTERQNGVGRPNPRIGRLSLRAGEPESSGSHIRPPSILSQRSELGASSIEDLLKEKNVLASGELRSPMAKPPLRKPLSAPTISSITIGGGMSPPPSALKSSKTGSPQPSGSRIRKPSPPTRLPLAVRKAEPSAGTGSDMDKGDIHRTPVRPVPHTPARLHPHREENPVQITPARPYFHREENPVQSTPTRPHPHWEENPIPQKPPRNKKIGPKLVPGPLDSSAISTAQSVQPLKNSPRRPPPQPPTSPPASGTLSPPSPPTSFPQSDCGSLKHSSFLPESAESLAAPNDSQPREESTDFADLAANEQPRNYEEYVPTLNRRKFPSADILAALQVGEESAFEGASEKVTTPVLERVEVRGSLQRSLSSASTLGRKSSPTKPVRPSPGGLAGSSDDDPPPLPPRNYSLEDSLPSLPPNMSSALVGVAQDPRHTLRSYSVSGGPPPLPSQPIPRRKTIVGCSPPTVSPNLKKREPLQSVYTLAEGPISPSSSPLAQEKTENMYEEINTSPYHVPRQWKKPGPVPPSLISPGIYQHYEMSDPFAQRPVPSYARLPPAGEYGGLV